MTRTVNFNDLVADCYRAILGREPENSSVVSAAANHFESAQDLINSFLQSAEYRSKSPDRPNTYMDVTQNFAHDRLDIEVNVDKPTLNQLFERVANQWKKLGETEPHWSVLTHDQFKADKVQDNLEAFYASGKDTVSLMTNVLKRNGIAVGSGQTCVELGCGVGRVSLPLAGLFDHVIGIDISPGNLKVAQQMSEDMGVKNIEFSHLSSVDEILNVSEYDVLFTVIVLQHNPPPVQLFILDALLSKMRPGGVAFFQIPTHLPKYSFDVKSYLASGDAVMDMHAVPMKEVMRCFDRNGMELHEVVQDAFTLMPGSHTFVATKSA